jgi:hypothetical protein
MIAMEPFEVYRYYLALRLHFTTETYDAIKQQGRVKASKQAFFKRKDLFAIKKVAESYSDKEVVNFLVANFVSGDRWGGVFDVNAKDRYVDWKKRIESISYTFEKELVKILNHAEKAGKSFDWAFTFEKNQHPLIMKMFLRNELSIESLVILNKLNGFVEKLDNELRDDLIWTDLSRIIKKYTPFLNIDKNKYDGIYRRAVGHND